MPTTLTQEMSAAARGVVALLLGNRSAAVNFDFSLRGLVGSFIVFIAAATINVYLPLLMGVEGGGPPWQALAMVALLYGLQLAFAGLFLRQIGRLDGLVPYMVADNWATFFVTILSAILGATGATGDFALVVIGIAVLVIEVNIARLIVTLRPLHVFLFLVAQLAGAALGLVILGAFLPDIAAS
ncbi:MAG TPA: hypothetical protein VIL84_13645 [Devosiaceae bacterium]